MNNIDEITELFATAIDDCDYARVNYLIKKYNDEVEGGGKDFAFRTALRLNNRDFVEYAIEHIKLNDAGTYSTYFDETTDEEIKCILSDCGADYPPIKNGVSV